MTLSKFSLFVYQCLGYVFKELGFRLSDSFHIVVSSFLSRFYHTSFSKYLIKPYCWWHYKDVYYYKKFVPGSGEKRYQNFQDFFTRSLKETPKIQTNTVWPCEGFLCQKDKVSNLDLVKVKGEERHLKTVFGNTPHQIDENAVFSNVFLHNNNYHRIHAPTNGVISRIEHIPGKLLLLRPWAYKNEPSLPALTNERINIDIKDNKGRIWFLSIVGGPLVAGIKLAKNVIEGASIKIAEEIACFEMGSTCCMISPDEPKANVGDMVDMGEPI